MPEIRLLVSVAADPASHSVVHGDAGAVIRVDAETANKWADGERAEVVVERAVPVEQTAVIVSPAASVKAPRPARGREARSGT